MRAWKILTPVVLIFAVLFASKGAIETRVGRRLERAFNGVCMSCNGTIEKTRISFLRARLELSGVALRAGNPRATQVEARIENLRVTADVFALLVGKLHARSIVIDSPEVVVREGDEKTPRRKLASAASEKHLEGEVDTIELHDGRFAYERSRKVGTGVLRLSGIEASTLSKIGNTTSLRDRPAKVKLQAKLERTGDVALEVEAWLGRPRPEAHIDLAISKLALADVNRFFEKNDALKLEGELDHGRAQVHLSGRRVDGRLVATYHGFDVSFESSDERSGISAFLQNLGTGLTMSSENHDLPLRERSRTIASERKRDETLISLVLRGMKEAVLKIVSRSK